MKQRLHQQLTAYEQTHLLDFWDSLAPAQQEQLARQILQIDFGLLRTLHGQQHAVADWHALAMQASPPPAVRLTDAQRTETAKQARALGEQLLSAGKVGVVLVAGGQGTRLGFDHPKGMFPIGPVSQATLFQVLFEKIAARARRHNLRIPLYLMTSPATHGETIEYLQANQFFGLPAEDVRVFCQGTMPAVDLQTGKVLLAEKHAVFESPDGHGGMLSALVTSGHLQDAQTRGIEYLFYCQVDNPLVGMCDPEFLGHHLLHQAEVSTQVVAKQGLRDKVGNVVMLGDRMTVLEYSDINPLGDEVLARQVDSQPVFWAGSIAVHVFNVDFLQRANQSASALPFHLAKKVVPHVDAAGNQVSPNAPNALKFERFIFDLLPAAATSLVVEVDPAEAFAPLKNAPNEPTDNIHAVQQARMALERRWLRAARVQITESTPIEISPLYADDEMALRQRTDVPQQIAVPTYLHE
jgi:UDP-N-acetylglucosamine/UDP-N-acetylgalactosamine diphosphorylase